jgi:NIPSNAP
MERRDFLTSTLGASILASAAGADALAQAGGSQPAAAPQGSGAPAPGKATPPGSANYFVWRQYALRSGPLPQRMTTYVRDALFPALGRLGVKPAGAFNVSAGPSSPTLHLITPHATIESAINLDSQLENDKEYMQAASDYLGAVPTDPAFMRQESALLQAFSNFTSVEVPAATASQGPRLFELRMYESPNEVAHRKKVDMFNKLGEVDIFRRVGIRPVFFSRTIIGPKMPNLVYMTVFDNFAAREKAWAAFGADADWKKLNGTAGFENIVSNISIMFLSPTPYSQI